MSLTRLWTGGPGDKFELVLVGERDQNTCARAIEIVNRFQREPYWPDIRWAVNISWLPGLYDFKSTRPATTGASAWLPCDRFAAAKVIAAELPTWDAAAILVTDLGGYWGGTQVGQNIAAFCVGQNGWLDLALHEIMGHAIGRCLDEYEDQRTYDEATSGVLNSPNVVSDSLVWHAPWSAMINTKWLPTRQNRVLVSSENVPPDTVGLFEGGAGRRIGTWRGYRTCKMREQPQPFCPICVAAIKRVLAPFMGVFEPPPVEPPKPAMMKVLVYWGSGNSMVKEIPAYPRPDIIETTGREFVCESALMETWREARKLVVL